MSSNAVAPVEPAAVPAAGDGSPQNENQGSWKSTIKSVAVQLMIMYFITSLFKGKSPQGTDPSKTGSPNSGIPGRNLYDNDLEMDMYVYISEDGNFSDYSDLSKLFWKLEGITYGNWYEGSTADSTFHFENEFPTPVGVYNNGSLFAHIAVTHHGRSPDPMQKNSYFRKATILKSKQLNLFKRRTFLKKKNLLTGELTNQDVMLPNETSKVEVLSHWHPNLTINMLYDHTQWAQGSVPAPLDQFIEFDSNGNYYPVVYFNDYWNFRSDYQPINETVETLTLSLTFKPISLFRWQMYAAQGQKSKWTEFLGDSMSSDDEEDETLKRAMVETNPYLLGVTIVVSIIHSVFEFLAFKNDIQFWKNRKSLEGLSVRSVFFNVFQSVIVLLYVLDNDTNTVIRFSIGIGLLIELWKISKVVNLEVDRANLFLGVVPRVRFIDKSTYVESDTRKYDRMAFKYVSWLCFPLLACYAVYSLLYQEHSGWYSWVLSMLYGFLLTFGFIMMTPQLFINYKLKSVAHLPWRMLTYKALNTFIDDLFAFVIQMPMMYRLGCLRDDFIFVIYIYQKWIYPVDPSRVNEYGTSGDIHNEIENQEGAIEDGSSTDVKAIGEVAEEANGGASNLVKRNINGDTLTVDDGAVDGSVLKTKSNETKKDI